MANLMSSLTLIELSRRNFHVDQDLGQIKDGVKKICWRNGHQNEIYSLPKLGDVGLGDVFCGFRFYHGIHQHQCPPFWEFTLSKQIQENRLEMWTPCKFGNAYQIKQMEIYFWAKSEAYTIHPRNLTWNPKMKVWFRCSSHWFSGV